MPSENAIANNNFFRIVIYIGSGRRRVKKKHVKFGFMLELAAILLNE